LNMIQASAMAGASVVIAIDRVASKLELAKSLGATHAIDSSKEDVAARIADILGKQVLDVFIDNTGAPPMIELGYAISGPKARVILVGVPRKGNDIKIYSLPLHFGKVLKGSEGGDAVPQNDIPRYMRMFNNGKLALRELMTDEFSLDEINTALDKMRKGEILGRCLVRMGK